MLKLVLDDATGLYVLFRGRIFILCRGSSATTSNDFVAYNAYLLSILSTEATFETFKRSQNYIARNLKIEFGLLGYLRGFELF